jgi:hypothetical protein
VSTESKSAVIGGVSFARFFSLYATHLGSVPCEWCAVSLASSL